MLRFNHMELTVPRGFVSQYGKETVRFFTEVLTFGVSAFPGMEEPHLILTTDASASQFLYIAESDTPLVSHGDDHLGMIVESAASVERILKLCTERAESDTAVMLRDLGVLDLEATTTRAFYLKYRLPIWFDIQSIDYKPGHEPAQRWRFGSAA